MEFKNVLRVGGVVGLMMLPLASEVSAGDVTMDVNAVLSSSITETVTQNLSFGTIDLAPTASTIRVNASSGAATPIVSAGSSIVTGGNSGTIRVTGNIDMTITVTYPTSLFTISNGSDTINVSNISANSEGGGATISHTGGTPTDIDVGGEIQLLGTEADGTYTDTMTITLDYS